MRKNTRAYFGAGVYAECTGFDIVVLTSNGVGNKATDRIYLDPQMIRELFEWQEAGYPDHETVPTDHRPLFDKIVDGKVA